MNVTQNNGILEFSGLLNEDSPIEEIEKQVEQALENSSSKTVKLDFSKVRRANSCGILAWYKIIEKLNGKFVYVQTPRWLVEQFNISDFLIEKCKVESIIATFYCPQNDTHENIVLTLGQEIPIKNSYDDFILNIKNKEGLDLEMDFEPNEYFYFISSNYDRMKDMYK